MRLSAFRLCLLLLSVLSVLGAVSENRFASLCDRLPRLMLLTASSDVRQDDCRQMLADLTDSMRTLGVAHNAVNTDELLVIISRYNSHLETFLISRKSEFIPILEKEKLLGELLGEDPLGVYLDLFRFLPMWSFPVVLFSGRKEGELVENMHKAVVLAWFRNRFQSSRRDVPPLHHVLRYAAALISLEHVPLDMAAAMHGTWVWTQDASTISDLDVVRGMRANQLYLMLKTVVADRGLSSYSRDVMHITLRKDSHTARPGLVNIVRGIPVEAHPLAKAACLTFKTHAFCESVVHALSGIFLDSSTAQKILHLRRLTATVELRVPALEHTVLEVDYGMDSELMAEYAHVNPGLLRAMHEAAKRKWPLLGRILRLREMELSLVKSEVGLVIDRPETIEIVKEQVNEVCKSFIHFYLLYADCIDPRRVFVKASLLDLQSIGNAGFHQRQTLAETLARRLLGLPTESASSVDHSINTFIRTRSVDRIELLDSQDKDCPICMTEYEDSRKAVVICNASGDFRGHFVCADCLPGIVNPEVKRLKCPICRKDVALSGFNVKDLLRRTLTLPILFLLYLSGVIILLIAYTYRS